MNRLRGYAPVFFSLILAATALGARADDTLPTIAHMLGYIGVDYPSAVRVGRVQDAAEYAEQQEFAARVVTLMERLPANADKAVLQKQAQSLVQLIAKKSSRPRGHPAVPRHAHNADQGLSSKRSTAASAGSRQ